MHPWWRKADPKHLKLILNNCFFYISKHTYPPLMHTRKGVGLDSNAGMIIRRSLSTVQLLHNFPFCKGLLVNIDQGSWPLQHTHTLRGGHGTWAGEVQANRERPRGRLETGGSSGPAEPLMAPAAESFGRIVGRPLEWVVTVGVRWPGRAAVFLSLHHTHTWADEHAAYNAFNTSEHIIHHTQHFPKHQCPECLALTYLCY